MVVENLRNLLNIQKIQCAKVKSLEKTPLEKGWNTGELNYTLDKALDDIEKHNNNYIILTGHINNIICVDFDLNKPGNYTMDDKQFLIDNFDTLIVSTPSGGLHMYFLYDYRFDEWSSTTGIHGNIDIRSNKAGVVGPGCRTINGSYTIVKDKPLIYMPDNLYNQIESEISKKTTYRNNKHTYIPCDNELPSSIDNKLKEYGYTGLEYTKNTYGCYDINYNHNGFKCIVCDRAHDHIQSYIYRNYRGYWLGCYSTSNVSKKQSILLHNSIKDEYHNLLKYADDHGFAHTLVKLTKGRLIVYDGVIYEWSGVYWKDYKILGGTYTFISNDLREYYMEVYNTVKTLYGQTPDGIPPEINKQLTKLLKRINDFGNIKSQANIIKSFVNAKQANFMGKWNSNPNLFAFENCIWDLEQKQFIEPNPEDYINLTCGYDYIEPDDTVVQHIKDVVRDINYDEETYQYILTVFASMLYRYNTRELIYFLTGSGGNGKGLLTDMFKSLFGNYSAFLPLSYYTTPTKAGANAELVAIRNARFIWTSETEATGNQQSVFYDAPLKTLTGGDEINCRPLYSNSIVKFVAGTPIVLTNTLPIFKGFDDSHKRRIRVIHLPWSYVENVQDNLSVINGGNQKRRDTKLKGKFMESEYKCGLFKILATEYYISYNQEIPLSQYIRNHTLDYFDHNDKLGKFLRTILLVDRDGKVSNDEVWIYYCKYIEHISKDSLGKLLKKQNSNYPNKVVKINGRAIMGVQGYRLNLEALELLENASKQAEIEQQVNNQDILDI